ncbi:enoyl-CoA hydratase/isomerase family protein [Gordonia soli]
MGDEEPAALQFTTGLPGAAVGVITDADSLDLASPSVSARLDRATFTLTEADLDDRRCVRVDSVDDAVRSIARVCDDTPIAAATCTDVLRGVDQEGPIGPALVTESLAYSTLQAGPEFRAWSAARGPASPVPDETAPVVVVRGGDTLRITFDRPRRHNAFTDAMRGILLDALTVALLDDSIRIVELSGTGRSFCSGGDLADFGEFADPASAHLARTRHSPAIGLDALGRRLGVRLQASVHGQVLGSGLEMAAFCGHVTTTAGARFGLPELSVGLIPGAGGTYSIPRRIGRWRCAYLVLSGETVDTATALRWGLVDEVVDPPALTSASQRN